MDPQVEWTLKRPVEQLDLPTTTTHRHLAMLMQHGYLVQDPIRKGYRPGPRLPLSSSILSQSDLRSTALPEPERLSARVMETINLSMLIDFEVFYLDKVETFRMVVCNTRVESRVPVHATSCGKIMLTYSSPSLIDAYCCRLPRMKPLNERTITSPDTLRLELVCVRLQGYAIDNEEIESELVCVGAPIIGMDRTATAAVSIAGPAFRMKTEPERMIQEVKETADAISRLLGGG